MALIEAKLHVDPVNDSAEIVVDVVGHDPFQHEFLKQLFADSLCTTTDEGVGTTSEKPHAKALGPEDLRLRCKVTKKGAFEAAKRALQGEPQGQEGGGEVAPEESAIQGEPQGQEGGGEVAPEESAIQE